ncbi:hypothetical protein SISSUDRAFT_1006916 [Sistotremastrum suecicum HHB10207 ss-3]|uniref:NAD(P)-binding domain-containing protein n=1 Tax=Sistotremastrum suecicum HHB10207 ss-3 TaxID=1314776 RepID=A0A166BYG3_9AGAM|nr:hypothetical protein SISSUDRAFT_1006916 [Sistotremastrum suecicum HHB10207 ss-3]
MSAKSALILGATGATGKWLLKDIIKSSEFSRVGELGRRVTDLSQVDASDEAKSKVIQQVIDFEKIGTPGDVGTAKLSEGWDVVFITLGTTRAAAGSAAAFEKIDREYVVKAAQAAKSSTPGHSQRIVYLSSGGASASSPFLYPKSKGLTEQALAALGYDDTIVFRPGLLKGRDTPRLGERVAGVVTGLLSHLSFSMEIDMHVLSRAILKAGVVGSQGLPSVAAASKVDCPTGWFTLIGNKGSELLGKD